MTKQAWHHDAPLTEVAVTELYPLGWRVSRKAYDRGRLVHGWTRAGTWYVVRGSATYNNTAIDAGEVLEVEVGNYKIQVGSEDLVMMCAWRLPSNTPNN
jgi:hypothetical protein